MAVIEFLNVETETAFKKSLTEQHLPKLAPKISRQIFRNGKPVFTVITME